ncbi:MAG: shikimate dehydrogenase [Oscillospiraceae bacterium]|nr:shikimate dehydrogenase [Oscillospiraceae bacterium]
MKYTLIGYPLGHSMSPWIHERLFALANRKAEYTLTEFPPEQLAEMIPELKKLKGFNITIPYKTDMLAYMQELDETAQRYSAVNCVATTSDGRSYGYNTDCDGFLRSVKNMPLDGKVLLIGCGGVGRMMATEAVIHGADLTISEPNQNRANALKEELCQNYQNANIRIAQADKLDENFDFIMNASPVGMYPNINACPVSDNLIQKSSNIFDVIYNPTETLLVKKAKSFVKKAVGGSAMLVWQAVRAHEIWDNSRYNLEDIQKLISDMEQEINQLFPVKE